MSRQTDNLYKVQKKDFLNAGVVLADAFQHDPFWKKVLDDAKIGQKRAFFEGSVRYGRRYGKVYATSEHLEGIAVWVPSDFADMTVWRAIRSGSFWSGRRMGMRRLLRMKPLFDPLEADRRSQHEGKRVCLPHHNRRSLRTPRTRLWRKVAESTN